MKTVSRENPLKHYQWGALCDGWNLVDTADLSVKMERMPPHTAEQEHYHQHARQFFFVLKGTATFIFTGGDTESPPDTPPDRIALREQEGLEIRPGLRHRILNEGEEDLEFILCSQPNTTGDRINT